MTSFTARLRVWLVLALVAGLTAMAAAGCGTAAEDDSDAADAGSTTTTAAAPLPAKFSGKPLQIALVRQFGSGDALQQWLAGAREQAGLLNMELQVSDASGKNDLQATQLQQAIDRGVDGIIIDHGVASALDSGIREAIRKGSPVAAVASDTRIPEVLMVRQDEAEVVKRIGDLLVRDLGGEGPVGYVYVAGFPVTDERDRGWRAVKQANPGIEQVAQFGKVSDTTAEDTAQQAEAVLAAHPDLKAILAPYDEYAKGVVLALNRAKRDDVSVYGVDISTPDIAVMTAPGSPWKVTIASDLKNTGRVVVRALALEIAGAPTGRDVEIPPSIIITQDFLRENQIATVQQLREKMPELNTKDVATADWMPQP